MEYCIDKKTKEKIFAFDIKNEYGIKDFLLEKKLRKMSINEELICPECGTPVILRAGEIKISHFSHKLKTKDCFFSTYTYNENRTKALKIFYDKIKKYKDVKILEFSKKFKNYGVIDIFLEGEDFFEKEKKYAILIKNTMENINKWEKLHIELLKEKITPIYFNYGTTDEIKKFKEKMSKSFFYRNLMNLTTNHGIRLINIEEKELYSISTTFYLNESNRVKRYENILLKNEYKDFFELIYNYKGENKYIFSEEEIKIYSKEILKYQKELRPFLMINANQEIFLVMNVDECNISGEEEFGSLEIKYIPLNYFMFNSIDFYSDIYFYPKEQLFKEECFSDYYSSEENLEKRKQEFFKSSDFKINKIISMEDSGIFENDIEEFIKNYREIKNNIFKYDYMSEDSQKDFKLHILENLNDSSEVKKIIKRTEDNSLEAEIEQFFSKQFRGFYEIILNKNYFNKMLLFLEDKIFICNDKKEIIRLEKLYEIFKKLSKINNSNKEFNLLFSYEETMYYRFNDLFSEMFDKNSIIINFGPLHFHGFYGEIYSLFRNKELQLNILNTYYKLTKVKSYEDKQYEVLEKSLDIYFKNKDLNLFLKNIENIEKEYKENYLIKSLDNIIKNNMKQLLKYMVKNVDLNKSFEKKHEILDYFLKSYIKKEKYNSFMEKIIIEKNIVLFEIILGTKYEENFSFGEIASILTYNYNFKEGASLIRKNILNRKIKLNKKEKNGKSLFFMLCSIANNGEFIKFCLENGADLYLENKNKKTPLMMLERRIRENRLQNFSLSNKKIEN